MIGAGLVSVVFGLVAMPQGQPGDANIGGVLLIVYGLIHAVGAAVVWTVNNRRRPPPPGPSA